MLYSSQPEIFYPKFEVASCFCELDGKILLLRRSDTSPQPDTWGMVAGKVEDGESPLQAVKRELKEETGIEADSNAFKLVQKTYIKFPEYDYIYYIYRMVLQGKPDIRLDPHEHKEYLWITPHDALMLENQMEDLDSCIKLCYLIS